MKWLLVTAAIVALIWLLERLYRAVDRRVFEGLIREPPDPRAFRAHSIESFRDDMRRNHVRRTS